jgi:hypothetical protein
MNTYYVNNIINIKLILSTTAANVHELQTHKIWCLSSLKQGFPNDGTRTTSGTRRGLRRCAKDENNVIIWKTLI